MMIEWICENEILKFEICDVIVERKFKNYLKDIKCKLIYLSLLLKIFVIKNI